MISAFATHSTGLKVKGDGLSFPRDWHNPQYRWGECPECQYWPQQPQVYDDELGLKACIFDNTGDGDYYSSSLALESYWANSPMNFNSSYETGGHCQIHSFESIAMCLNDPPGRLCNYC